MATRATVFYVPTAYTSDGSWTNPSNATGYTDYPYDATVTSPSLNTTDSLILHTYSPQTAHTWAITSAEVSLYCYYYSPTNDVFSCDLYNGTTLVENLFTITTDRSGTGAKTTHQLDGADWGTAWADLVNAEIRFSGDRIQSNDAAATGVYWAVIKVFGPWQADITLTSKARIEPWNNGLRERTSIIIPNNRVNYTDSNNPSSWDATSSGDRLREALGVGFASSPSWHNYKDGTSINSMATMPTDFPWITVGSMGFAGIYPYSGDSYDYTYVNGQGFYMKGSSFSGQQPGYMSTGRDMYRCNIVAHIENHSTGKGTIAPEATSFWYRWRWTDTNNWYGLNIWSWTQVLYLSLYKKIGGVQTQIGTDQNIGTHDNTYREGILWIRDTGDNITIKYSNNNGAFSTIFNETLTVSELEHKGKVILQFQFDQNSESPFHYMYAVTDLPGNTLSPGPSTIASTSTVKGLEASITAYDQFIDTTGTLLESHTSDSSHTWTEVDGLGEFEINENTAKLK